MKKVYKTSKWKRYSRRVSLRNLKRKRRKGKKRVKKHPSERYQRKRIRYQDGQKRRKKVSLEAPEVFSIVKNPEHTLSFFHDYYHYVQKDKQIFFDLTKVREITEDAILYMLSRFHYSEKKLGHVYVSGNIPSNTDCQRLLMESGFYDYVHYNGRILRQDEDILSIITKEYVHSTEAKKIIDFTKTKLGRVERSCTKSTYIALIECMANTRNHAYENPVTDPLSRWWLIAMYNKNTNSVHFTFLDNGLGIPRTIRKKFLEKIAGIWGGNSDGELIASALKGEFRTQTGEKWRGKGLPKIRSCVIKGEIQNLKVISSQGYVTCNGDGFEVMNLANKFHGTLLSWDICGV